MFFCIPIARRTRYSNFACTGGVREPMIMSQEIDTRTGQHLGNFPQALTHLALINAVISVIRAERGLRTSEMLASSETTVSQPSPSSTR